MITIDYNVPLRDLNTLRLEATAGTLVRAGDEAALLEAIRSGRIDPGAVFLGGGSNILLATPVLETVIVPINNGIEIIGETADHILITCGAGLAWDDLVAWTVGHGYGGLENLSGIPGSVGASPIQNIGAYGCEVSLCIESVRVIDIAAGEAFNLLNHECRFGYRDSIFKTPGCRSWLVWEVTFQLEKEPRVNLTYEPLRKAFSGVENPSPARIREEVIRIRESKLPDPKALANAGSFFRNPVVAACQATVIQETYDDLPVYYQDPGTVKIPAGWLIEKCGWKGYREGQVGVYDKQALVLVNFGSATAPELIDLADRIKQSVRDRFGIDLESEVRLL
jgi:UDP-N-acetylmuramate dehydrogenase